MFIRLDGQHFAIGVDGLFYFPLIFEADAYVDERVEVESACGGLCLFCAVNDEVVLINGEFVLPIYAIEVGEVVVADGVVSIDCERGEVASLGLNVFANCAVAVAHVAEGLEVVGIERNCAHVALDGLIETATGLFLLASFEVVFCLLLSTLPVVAGGGEFDPA